MRYANDIADLIGNTPIIRLQGSNIYAKCEFLNPSGSVKARMAEAMLKEALRSGKIDNNTHIIEPTSGNTGIGLAMLCASLGLKLSLTMPSSMSIERRKLLSAYGAEIILTEASLGMKGAVDKALELALEIPNSFVPEQFSNQANPKVHYDSTAQEIWRDMDGKIDMAVIAVGTGGTLSGIGKFLKEKNPNILIVAVEPSNSAVLSGNPPAPHKIQGIGAGFVPKILDSKLIDEIFQVSNEDALKTARNLAKNEGLLVGISSGANVYASRQIAKKYEDKNIITILCDTGERYLSTELFE